MQPLVKLLSLVATSFALGALTTNASQSHHGHHVTLRDSDGRSLWRRTPRR